MQRLSNLYESVDTLREKYGKHTVFLGASFLAHTEARSMTASAGMCRIGRSISFPERRPASAWASRCLWVRSSERRSHFLVQHHGIRHHIRRLDALRWLGAAVVSSCSFTLKSWRGWTRYDGCGIRLAIAMAMRRRTRS
jgi:hypothetical protein